jgi:TrmH family RNA methyltransferase
VADPLRIVLVSPRNPLNIGAAARAMSNFGFTELRLVKPYDVAFREARSAVRSEYILQEAKVFDHIAAAVSDCALVIGTTAAERRNLQVPLYRLETAASLVKEQLATTSVALVFGSEKFGLSNEDLSYCNWLLRIPTRPEHGSMNLGQAVAVCLYELRRQAETAGERVEMPRRAAAGDYECITGLLMELLDRSGYFPERTTTSSELKIRRLVRRLVIPHSDVQKWLGILRQILWKVKNLSEPHT